MQRNISPVTAVIVILVVIAIAAFAWMKYSVGPAPVSPREVQQRGAGTKRQANRRQPTGERRAARQAEREAAREGQGGQAGSGTRAPSGAGSGTKSPTQTKGK